MYVCMCSVKIFAKCVLYSVYVCVDAGVEISKDRKSNFSTIRPRPIIIDLLFFKISNVQHYATEYSIKSISNYFNYNLFKTILSLEQINYY